MGGTKHDYDTIENRFNSKTLNKSLKKIINIDKKRGEDVFNFYHDLKIIR